MAALQQKSDDRSAQTSQADRGSSRNAIEAARRTADEAARSAREIGSEAAEAGNRMAGAGVELARTGAETVQRAFQSSVTVAAEMARRSAEQFANAWGLSGEQSRKTIDESRQNLQAIVESGQVLAQRSQDITREWFSLAQGQAGRNFEKLDALLRSRTPREFLAAQSSMARDNLEFMLNSSRRLAEMSVEITAKAAERITAEADQVGRHAARH
jgi:phasin family protein